jgi:hypothetical protein
MPQIRDEKLAQTSTNSFASILKMKVYGRRQITVVISNSHATNIIQYRVLVSNDEEGAANTWAIDKADTDVVANNVTLERHVVTGAFVWVDVQIKSKTADTHGTGNCWMYAVGL